MINWGYETANMRFENDFFIEVQHVFQSHAKFP